MKKLSDMWTTDVEDYCLIRVKLLGKFYGYAIYYIPNKSSVLMDLTEEEYSSLFENMIQAGVRIVDSINELP